MKKTILLVEDNPDDQLLISRVFKKYLISNEVVVLHDGAEALRWLLLRPSGTDPGNQLPELILLSLKLAKVGGLELLRRIRGDERTKHIPVVVLTSSDEEGQSVENELPGRNSYVCKPVDFAGMSRAFNKLGLSWTLVGKLSDDGDGPLINHPQARRVH